MLRARSGWIVAYSEAILRHDDLTLDKFRNLPALLPGDFTENEFAGSSAVVNWLIVHWAGPQ